MDWGKLAEFVTVLYVTYKGATKADTWIHEYTNAVKENTAAMKELTDAIKHTDEVPESGHPVSSP